MGLVQFILGAVFVIFVAVMAFRNRSEIGKPYQQRREELYEYSQQRLEEFKRTEMKRETKDSEE